MSLDFPFRPGRKPPYPDFVKPRLWLDDFLPPTPELVELPTTADWGTAVNGWAMALNDRLGTCGIAGMNNLAIALGTYGSGYTTVWTGTTDVQLYETLGGYVPGDPATDGGTNLQDNLNYWRKNAIQGSQILAFGALKPGSWLRAERIQALRTLGPLYLGLNLPQSAVDQFPGAWTYVPGSPLAGGHCVIQAAEMMGLNEVRMVSWQETVDASTQFMLATVEEAWLVIDEASLERNQQTQYGVDVAGMNQALASLTGESNPLRLKTIR